jgi:low affinity Fe/Cu permease
MSLLYPEQQQIVRLLRWIALFTGVLAMFVVVCSALFVWACSEGITIVEMMGEP